MSAATRSAVDAADLGRPVIAGLQHALAAQHLEALVVAVRRTAAGVDLREAPAARADGHRGASMSPAAPTAGSVRQLPVACTRHRVVVEDPAEDVEVVDQHVAEDAAGAPDVLDRRRAGVAAGHHQHLRLADLARVEARLQRRERRIVATLEPDEAGHARLRHRLRAVARAVEREVDRLLAEDRLARRRRAHDQVGVGVGGRGDHHRAHVRVGEDRVGAGDLCAVPAGESAAAAASTSTT